MTEYTQEPFTCEAFPGLEFSFQGNRDNLYLHVTDTATEREATPILLSRGNYFARRTMPPGFPLLTGTDRGCIPIRESSETSYPEITYQRPGLPPLRMRFLAEGPRAFLQYYVHEHGEWYNLFSLRDGRIERHRASEALGAVPQLNFQRDGLISISGFPEYTELTSDEVQHRITYTPVETIRTLIAEMAEYNALAYGKKIPPEVKAWLMADLPKKNETYLPGRNMDPCDSMEVSGREVIVTCHDNNDRVRWVGSIERAIVEGMIRRP